MTTPNPPASSVSWKYQAMALLGEEGFPRAFGLEEFEKALHEKGFTPSRSTLNRVIREWAAAGLIRRVAQGVFLNMQAFPQPIAQEATPILRPGAIVSLGTVLGDAGVLNNPTPWVMAVLPAHGVTRHATHLDSVPGVVFKFAYMQPRLVPSHTSDWASDAYEARTRVPTATPEKALLDWIYLSSVGASAARWRLPASHDIDMDYLDEGRLSRLSERMGLQSELAQFQESLQRAVPSIKIRRPRR